MRKLLSVVAVSTATAAYLSSTAYVTCAHEFISSLSRVSTFRPQSLGEYPLHKNACTTIPFKDLPYPRVPVKDMSQRQLYEHLISKEQSALFSLLQSSCNLPVPGDLRSSLLSTVEPCTISVQQILSCASEVNGIKTSTTLQSHLDTSRLSSELGHVRCEALLSSTNNDLDGKKHKPDIDQLLRVQEYLIDHLPSIFVKRQQYDYFHQDIVLENNYWSKAKVTEGIRAYVMEMMKVRFMAHARYSHVKLDLLKISPHEDESCVKVRWRVSGITTLQSFKFWKFLPGRWRNTVNKEPIWHDGISTFYVNKDGLIVKHKVDRMMPADRPSEAASRLGLKTAALLGLVPKQATASSNQHTHSSPVILTSDTASLSAHEL